MRRTVRTRGARASYCGPHSSSYSDVAQSDNDLSLQHMENILTQNIGNYGQDNLQGLFAKIDGISEQNCNTSTATDEEIAVCKANLDERNLERLRLCFPYIQYEKIIQIYELCENNIIRTLDNIHFYSHMNLAIQNAFHKMRESAFDKWNGKHSGREDYEAFAYEFIKGAEQKAENESVSEFIEQEAVAGPSHFEC